MKANDANIGSRHIKNSATLTQIMRVKAWVRTDEDAESNSLHTLFIVLWIRLSRESPEEETKASQRLLVVKVRLSLLEQKPGGESKDTKTDPVVSY